MSTSPPVALDRIVAGFRDHPGVRQKANLALVTEVLGGSDWIQGPGDDAAALPTGDGHLLAAGEALWPPFVEADPHGAGIAAVLANVNDIAAMGGRCLGLLDTWVGAEPAARAALEGLRWAAEAYGVPLLGGHLTLGEGAPALSAFAVGRAGTLLSARHAHPGQVLLSACATQGQLRGDFGFFPAFEQRGDALPGDVAVLADTAEAGEAVAAKDVSMAGLLGSLAMLLEPSGCGVALDLNALPRPPEVGVETWVSVFPSYGFLLCAPPSRAEACRARFTDRGLACAPVGHLDATGQLRARLDGHEALVADLAREPVTRLAPPADGGSPA
jgi:selenophosphate synthetase-related protein